MANISLTQKAAKALKIDSKNLTSLASSDFDDWLVTDIWDSKRDPWLFFMHKPSLMCFVVKPTKYKIHEAINSLLSVIRRYLDDNGMLHKFQAFEKSLSTIELYKNSDTKATANINARRSELYYREEPHFDTEHLNYILNLRIHTRFAKDPNHSTDYEYMYKLFNEYLEQVPSYGFTSVKKPDYYAISWLGAHDYTIAGTQYYKDLNQFFTYVPEHIQLNTICGIAFGIMVLSDGIENSTEVAIDLAKNMVRSDQLAYDKNMLSSFFIDIVASYSHIMKHNPKLMYSIDYQVPTMLDNISGNGLYAFALGLLSTIFLLFKFENRHRNHPSIMSRQAMYQKLEDFVFNNPSNGNNLEYDGFVVELPTILNSLYAMHIEAKSDIRGVTVH